MRTIKHDGIIIKTRNFSEKDRILTLFSKESGKVEVIAKGARRPGSLLSRCDIGGMATFHIYKTRSIDILREVSNYVSPEGARGQFLKTQKVSHLLRLVSRVYEIDDVHTQTYFAL